MPRQRWFGIIAGGYIEKETRTPVRLWHVRQQTPARAATRTRPATRTQYGPIIASFSKADETYAKRELYEERRKQGLPLELEPTEVALTRLYEQKRLEWENRWQDSSLWKTRRSSPSLEEPSALQKVLLAGVADLEFYLTCDERATAFYHAVRVLETVLEALVEACNQRTKRRIEKALDEFLDVDPQNKEAWREGGEGLCDLVAAATQSVGEDLIGEFLVGHYDTMSERYDQ